MCTNWLSGIDKNVKHSSVYKRQSWKQPEAIKQMTGHSPTGSTCSFSEEMQRSLFVAMESECRSGGKRPGCVTLVKLFNFSEFSASQIKRGLIRLPTSQGGSVRSKRATEVKHLGQCLAHSERSMNISWSPNDCQYPLNEKCKRDNPQ